VQTRQVGLGIAATHVSPWDQSRRRPPFPYEHVSLNPVRLRSLQRYSKPAPGILLAIRLMLT